MNPKSIVIVSALYPPEPVVSAQLSVDIANYIAHKGHNVTVLCPYPSRPFGVKYEDIHIENVLLTESGVTVVHLPSYIYPQSKLWGRMRESLSFGIHVSQYIQQHCESANVIYANTWPVLGQWMLTRKAKKLSIPLVLHIQDVYPEAMLNRFPLFLKKILAYPFFKIDQFCAQQSKILVVVSENMKLLYNTKRGIPNKKIRLIQNWQDHSAFMNDYSHKKDIEKRDFSFMYLGNIGTVAGVDFLINAFHKAQLVNSKLIIVGNGSEKAKCLSIVKDLQLSNVFFETIPFGLEAVAKKLSEASVLLLPVKTKAAMSSVPSKLISYLFSGKAVIATVDEESDTAKTISDSGCGWVGQAENLTWLSCKMKEVSQMSEDEIVKRGHLGRDFALKYFSKSRGCSSLYDTIINATL